MKIDTNWVYVSLETSEGSRYNGTLDRTKTCRIRGYLRIEFPVFTPDSAHIAWVRNAWNLQRKPLERKAYPSDEDFDPIPF